MELICSMILALYWSPTVYQECMSQSNSLGYYLFTKLIISYIIYTYNITKIGDTLLDSCMILGI